MEKKEVKAKNNYRKKIVSKQTCINGEKRQFFRDLEFLIKDFQQKVDGKIAL